MHWACEECIVRVCCIDPGCDQTKLVHPLCRECESNLTCTQKCEKVLFSEILKRLDKRYNLTEIACQHIIETSPLFILSRYYNERN